MNKFQRLTDYLIQSNQDKISMSFAEIERLIKSKLPESSKHYRAYFSNSYDHSFAKAWMDAGYLSQDVDLREKRIVFAKNKSFNLRFCTADLYEKIIQEKKDSNFSAITAPSLETLFINGRVPAIDIKNYMNQKSICVYGRDGKKTDFDRWYDAACTSKKFNSAESYRQFTKVVWMILLFNIMDPDAIVDNDVLNSFTPKINLTDYCGELQYFKEFKRLILSITGKPMEQSTLEAIKGLKNKPLIQPFDDIPLLRLAYIRHAINLLIENTVEKQPWVPPRLFLEMLDLEIILNIDGAKYFTTKAYGFEFLLGKARDALIEDSSL